MSILDSLRHPRARGYEKSYPQGFSPFVAYDEALNDVREALTNPTDEQVSALRLVQNRHAIRAATWLVIGDQHAWACDECDVMLTGEEAETHALRMVLAAAAGGDQ